MKAGRRCRIKGEQINGSSVADNLEKGVVQKGMVVDLEVLETFFLLF